MLAIGGQRPEASQRPRDKQEKPVHPAENLESEMSAELQTISKQLDQLLEVVKGLQPSAAPATPPTPSWEQRLGIWAAVLSLLGVLVATVRGVAFKDDVDKVEGKLERLGQKLDEKFDPLSRDVSALKATSESSAKTLDGIHAALLAGLKENR